MALKDRKNTDGQGIVGPIERENPFKLTQRQHLIQKLNDLLYKTQIKKITDEQVSEILKRLSTI